MQQSSQVFLWDYSRSWNDSSELFRSLGGFTFKTAFCPCCSPPCRCCWTCLKLVARFWNHSDEFFQGMMSVPRSCIIFVAADFLKQPVQRPSNWEFGYRTNLLREVTKSEQRFAFIVVGSQQIHCCHLGYASEEQHQGCHFSKEWSEEWIWTSNFWNTKRVETADFCNCTCIKDKSNGVPSSTTVTSTLFRRSPWLFLTKEPKNASVGSSRKRAIRRLGKSGWVSSKYAESPTFLSFNIASVAGNVGFLGFLQQERPLKRDDGMKGCFTTLDCDFFPKLEPWGLDPWFLRLLKVEGVNIQWFFVAVWCWNGPVVKGSEGN